MSDEAASRVPSEAAVPAAERRQRRRAWPLALVTALVLVLGLQLWHELSQERAGRGAVVGRDAGAGVGTDQASGAGRGLGPAVGGSMGAGSGAQLVGAGGVEPSPQLAQATETAVRVARAASAALAVVRQRNEPLPPPERSLELCDLGRLTVQLPPPLPAGNAPASPSADAVDAAPSPAAAPSTAPSTETAAGSASGAAVAGWVSAPASWAIWSQPPGLPPALGVQARAAAWPEVLVALEAPGQGLRARAAAQLLRASGLPAAELAIARRVVAGAAEPGEGAASPPPGAALQPRSAEEQVQSQAVAQLARLARPTARSAQPVQGDATVLRWALALCARSPRPGADCRRIGARELTRLAPDDSASWLALAAQPEATAPQREAAWQRAAQAPQFSGLAASLAQQVDAVWPAHLPGYLRTQMLAQAIDLERRLQAQAVPALLQSCSEEALQQPATRTRCDALGRLAQARGPDLAWLGVARVLGQRLAWPDAERHALRNEEATLQLLAAQPLMLDQPLACPALASTRAWVQAVATQGEMGWLRQQRPRSLDLSAGAAGAPVAPVLPLPGPAPAATDSGAGAGR